MTARAEAVEAPEVEVLGDTYRFRWLLLGLEAELSRFVEHRDSLVAELLMAVISERDGRPVRKLLHRSNMNLLAANTRRDLARALTDRRDDVPWSVVLEQIVFLAVERYREGEPTIFLPDVNPRERPRWFLKPYVEYGGPTVLFGPGGTGKSYLALAAAVTMATGRPVWGVPQAAPGPVLYLDWETDQYTHAERLQALCHDTGIVAPPIYYRRMVSGLGEALAVVQREIGRLRCVAAIVDSLMAARGDDPESAGATTRLFGWLRALRVPTIGVDHVTKEVMQRKGGDNGRLSPFGSIATENRARNTWSVRRAGDEGDESDDVGVLLVHEKTNNGRYQKRHAYRLRFSNSVDETGEEQLDALVIRPAEVGDFADFEANLPLAERILRHMREQPDGTTDVADVADALGVARGAVAPWLSRLKQRGTVVYLRDRKRYGLAPQRVPGGSAS